MSPTLRFATFNISSGRAPGRPFDGDRFAGAMAALDADVICLQEVDRDQRRSDGADLTELAAAALGAEHRVFAPTLYGTPGHHWTPAGGTPQDGPAYGCALISRLPLHDVELIRIPAAPVVLPLWVPGTGPVAVREEPRVVVVARVAVAAEKAVTVMGTHLPFVPIWNRRQLTKLVDRAERRPDPLLLLGDLNLRGPVVTKLTGWHSLHTAPTFPVPQPRLQLDHVLLRRPGSLGTVIAADVPTSAVSDHRPLLVDVSLR